MAFFTDPSIFGLDISDHSIECLLLTKGVGKIYLKSYSRVELAPGIVENGVILDKKKLSQLIVEALSKARPKKITSKKVIFSLPESRTFIHIFKSSEIPKGTKLKEEMVFEAAKIIPLELKEIYNDFTRYENGDILFAASPKKIVNDYLEVMKNAGLKTVALDIESLSIGRAMLTSGGLKESFMVADIGARFTNLSIFDKYGLLRVSSTIKIAGNKFSRALARELNLYIEKAEKLKQTYGLDAEKGDKKVVAVLEREVSPIIEKIRELLAYYHKEVKKILLVGGSAQMPKIASYFSKKLNINTELGKSKIASQFKKESVLYENVIGLALRGLEEKPAEAGINLLPPIFKKKPLLQLFLQRRIKLWIAITFLIIEALLFLAGVKTIFNELDRIMKGIKINIEQIDIMEQKLQDGRIKVID